MRRLKAALSWQFLTSQSRFNVFFFPLSFASLKFVCVHNTLIHNFLFFNKMQITGPCVVGTLVLNSPVEVTLSVHNPLHMRLSGSGPGQQQLHVTLIAASPSERDLIALCVKALVNKKESSK